MSKKSKIIKLKSCYELRTDVYFGDVRRANKLGKVDGIDITKDELEAQTYLIYVLCGSPEDTTPADLADKISLHELAEISNVLVGALGNL